MWGSDKASGTDAHPIRHCFWGPSGCALVPEAKTTGVLWRGGCVQGRHLGLEMDSLPGVQDTKMRKTCKKSLNLCFEGGRMIHSVDLHVTSKRASQPPAALRLCFCTPAGPARIPSESPQCQSLWGAECVPQRDALPPCPTAPVSGGWRWSLCRGKDVEGLRAGSPTPGLLCGIYQHRRLWAPGCQLMLKGVKPWATMNVPCM